MEKLMATSRMEVRQASETITTAGAQAQANSPVLNALNERLETSLARHVVETAVGTFGFVRHPFGFVVVSKSPARSFMAVARMTRDDRSLFSDKPQFAASSNRRFEFDKSSQLFIPPQPHWLGGRRRDVVAHVGGVALEGTLLSSVSGLAAGRRTRAQWCWMTTIWV
jgi:hypothetical protein